MFSAICGDEGNYLIYRADFYIRYITAREPMYNSVDSLLLPAVIAPWQTNVWRQRPGKDLQTCEQDDGYIEGYR